MTPEAKDNRSRFESFLKTKLRPNENPAKYARSLDEKIKRFYRERLGSVFVSLYELTDTDEVYTIIQDLVTHPALLYRLGRSGDSRVEGLNWYLAYLSSSKSRDATPEEPVVRSSKRRVRLATPEMEGKHIKREQTVILRNQEARKKCIERYGCRCAACNLVMSEKYGAIADGFIEVHHLNPIHLFDDAHVVDPITDLIPLCPNCHAMIHKLEDPSDIEGLKQLIEDNK